ncbi:hypothetical protein [Halomicrobium katesii]|uniref:hypothetical protein n=1 Tax=Halomicrobium katesii TaxID=437163 RepID=UPI0003670196|nr:hypothetical protein [Halomicrobium katesii]
MLTLDLDDFMFELKDGAIKHVGPSNRTATAKLYDVEGIDVREFGDERVKFAFEDDDGSRFEVALTPEQASEVARGVETLESESQIYE